jgi:hypothetical protein
MGLLRVPKHVKQSAHVKTVPAMGTYLPKKYNCKFFCSLRNLIVVELLK